MHPHDIIALSGEDRQVANGLAQTPDVRATDAKQQQYPPTYLMEVEDSNFTFAGGENVTSSSIPLTDVGRQVVDIESYALKFVKPINSKVSGELSGDAKVAASAVHIVLPTGTGIPDLLTRLHTQRPFGAVKVHRLMTGANGELVVIETIVFQEAKIVEISVGSEYGTRMVVQYNSIKFDCKPVDKDQGIVEGNVSAEYCYKTGTMTSSNVT